MPKSQEDMEEIGMDFEDGFSDDDDINFGMDDQDEAKEAKKRIFGKGVAGGGGEHDDDGGVWKGSSARVCLFSLFLMQLIVLILTLRLFHIKTFLANRKESSQTGASRSIHGSRS